MKTDIVVYEQNEKGEYEQIDLHTELQARNDEIKAKLQEAYNIFKRIGKKKHT